MTDRWQQIEKICQSALELEESRRGALLHEINPEISSSFAQT
jgi:hypothetical protein